MLGHHSFAFPPILQFHFDAGGSGTAREDNLRFPQITIRATDSKGGGFLCVALALERRGASWS